MRINDYEFTETCLDFLKGIESSYNEKLLIEEKSLKESEHGFSKYENRIPLIELNENEPFKSDIILHEAFHLKLKIEGMPNIGFELPNGINSENNRVYLEWFAHLFWDKVTHHYFYKIFDEYLDISPFEPFKVEIDKIIQSGEIKGLADATKEIALAGYLLQVFVETNEQIYIDKFKEFLEIHYESIGVEKGEELIQIFKDNPLNTFDNCIELFVLLFDFIHNGQGIKIKGYKRESKENDNFIENFILYRIV